MASDTGLRARKKAQTRRDIARTAGRLFGERGYEQVTIAEVARAAGVAEQTVYNYFPTKPDLVLDRADEIREALAALVAARPRGTSPAAALHAAALAEVERQRGSSPEQARGELPALAATSPTVRRLALEARDAQAQAVAAAIVDTVPGIDPLVAKVHASALLAVFQVIVDHTGRRLAEGARLADIADELAPSVDTAMTDLDRLFVPGGRS